MGQSWLVWGRLDLVEGVTSCTQMCIRYGEALLNSDKNRTESIKSMTCKIKEEAGVISTPNCLVTVYLHWIKM